MKKNTICILVFVGLLLFFGSSFAQNLTDLEWKIYCDLLDTSYSSSREYSLIQSEVATRHGISVSQLTDIEDKAFDKEPTDWEWKVAEDLVKRLNSLPKESSWEVKKTIFKEIAAKYKLNLCQLYDIDSRCMTYWLW